MPSVVVRRFQAAEMEFILLGPDGSPVNLTGMTLKFAAKRLVTDPDSLAYFDVTATLVSATTGRYKITLTRSQTVMPPGSYPAELRYWKSGTAPPADQPSGYEPSSFQVDEAVIQIET